MNVRPALTVGGMTLLGLVTLAGPASAVCDAYSGTCTEPPAVLNETLTPPGVLDQTVTPPAENRGSVGTAPTRGAPVARVASTPATLPFTGGELVLVSALGAAALAGGTALVVAGRRRADSPPA